MAHSLPCRASRTEALRYLGYAGQPIEPALDARLQAALSACEAGRPSAGVFAIFPLEHCGGEAEGEGAVGEAGAACSTGSQGVFVQGAGLLLPGADIVRFLEGATHCVLMAVTLGAQREQELQRRAALSATDALLYDAACSALAEAAADALQERVARSAAGCGLEMLAGRFSPGYGDLPLDVQKPLLAVLDAYRALGLAVTESCLLVPRKSVTAVVGLRPAGEAAVSASAPAVLAGEPRSRELRAGDPRVGDPRACDPRTLDSRACSANRSNSCDACTMADCCAFRRPIQERNLS